MNNQDERDIEDFILLGLDEEAWELIQKNGIDFIYPSGRTALGIAVYEDKEKSAFFLLEKGADPNIFKEGGNSPLMDAYIECNPRIFTALMMYGADPSLGKKREPNGTIYEFNPLHDLQVEGIQDFIDRLFAYVSSAEETPFATRPEEEPSESRIGERDDISRQIAEQLGELSKCYKNLRALIQQARRQSGLGGA